MQEISKLRFDALAGYYRMPMAYVVGEELGWFEAGDEKVLGVLIRDREDDDFLSAILGRDQKRCFRCVHMSESYPTEDGAQRSLEKLLDEYAAKPEEAFDQGDETGKPVDFFAPVVSEGRLHRSFASMVGQEVYSPARELIAAMMYYFGDPDGNFVEQFQTTGFDARIWELYLFATFTELNYAFDRDQPAPDFHCLGLGAEFFVEATTVNPTMLGGEVVEEPIPEDVDELANYLRNFLPIKFGSALFSKLQKRYWEKPHVVGKPLILAIQDFHQAGSMTWTQTALLEYLFGFRYLPEYEADGTLTIKPQRIETHQWGEKEIPSGFFSQEGAENISAVVYNTSGTISKFNRMGWMAGFGSRRVRMRRTGTCYNHSPNAAEPSVFDVHVHQPGYMETWAEGLNVVHNPWAITPVPDFWFPGAGHHYLDGDRYVGHIPEFHPFGSITQIGIDEVEASSGNE